jgi:Ca-activated chloride channel family protein
MKLENPILLHLLWALLLQALLLAVYWRWRQRTLRRLGSPALAERLLLGFSEKRFWLKNGLFAGAVALIVLAIANPQQAVRRTPPPQWSADVIIGLDISRSMLAKDAPPSRLEQAKKMIRDLVASLDGERIGLIFFAGDAYAQMPLSTDYEALLMFVNNATPDYITDQGTDFIPPIDLAARLFSSNPESGHALILISDGEQHAGLPLERARQAHGDGMIIHTVSVGADAGAMIPTADGYKRDFSGAVIRTKANPGMLREIAAAGEGLSLSLNNSNTVPALTAAVNGLQKSAVEAKAYTDYVSYFQWLLLPALLLLVLEQVLWWRKKGKGNSK